MAYYQRQAKIVIYPNYCTASCCVSGDGEAAASRSHRHVSARKIGADQLPTASPTLLPLDEPAEARCAQRVRQQFGERGRLHRTHARGLDADSRQPKHLYRSNAPYGLSRLLDYAFRSRVHFSDCALHFYATQRRDVDPRLGGVCQKSFVTHHARECVAQNFDQLGGNARRCDERS